MQYLGEIFLFPVVDGRSIAGPSTDFQFFYPCDGVTLPVDAHDAPSCGPPVAPTQGPANLPLATLLGADVSRSDATFTLPDLAPPAEGVGWFIANTGAGTNADDLPVVGEISLVRSAGPQFDPDELVLCDGQLRSVQQLPVLFSVLGTAFGGDGVQTFGVPSIPAPDPSLSFAICTTGTVVPLVPYSLEVRS